MSSADRGLGELAASIVVIAGGGWRWTELALQALAEHTTSPHEVIVVDNASTDAKPGRLRERQDINTVLNAPDEGFGPACNRGAGKARGRQLVFLNAEVVVHPGWLQPLLAVLDADPAVGAVGPRFLYPDGRLQDAGKLIARDGTVMHYGDGAAANALQFRFPRTVDCCSGACLAVRRETFEAIGGFDVVWDSADYEDIDLCLRLRDAGHRVIFEPAATVTRVRSGSGNFEGVSEQFQGHRRRFVERWGHRLTGRPPSLHSRSPAAIMTSRDAPAHGRILVCDDRVDTAAVKRSSAVVASVLTALPEARVTWCTDALAAGRLDPGPWLRRGVEFVEDPSENWLESRRFGLDVVFSGEIADARLARALGETQPQALRVPVDAAVGAVEDRLADAGLSA